MIEIDKTESESPVLRETNKDETMRLCMYLRRMNAAKVPEMYPLVRIEHCIYSLGEEKVFSELEYLWEYSKGTIAEDESYNTTFRSHMDTF